ncbi:MBL fold metallo-hydrolase [Brevibacillus sp. WF146]|uniref:MBL fold metallo-hydrolase n=1 Tax=Brevibacillus sp. WF146 TaxID=319501 RepID=UPI0007EC7D45|nr:MBL fold metallo-hydrolase [Brevibacillus sp. WF146]UYZ13079.1 MBL fold metallo-hydrolase [Brevibacillus sp. WF146]
MKVEQVSEHIWSLKSWLLIPVRVWVVTADDGVTLVDAGLPFMTTGILRFIDGLNAGPLQRILLTHGHSDHVGAIRGILDRYAVPVYAHRIEIPYMEGALPYPRRKKPERNVANGLAAPLAESPDGQLEPIAGLKPYLTPGHSPGHVVYYHEQDRVLLAGDLFTSKNGQLRRPMPMFTADMAEAVKSSAIVQELMPRRLEVCHSGPVFAAGEQVAEYMRMYG